MRNIMLNEVGYSTGPIIYWMSRDQRVKDNWALIHACELAQKHDTQLLVVFALTSDFPGANIRHYDFMIKGLKVVENDLRGKNIAFDLRIGTPIDTIPKIVDQYNAGYLVTDHSPLKISKLWRNEIAENIKIPFIQVDAHNVVPVWEASDKQEYSAYTIRRKIQSKLPEYLIDLPTIPKFRTNNILLKEKINWDKIMISLKIDRSISRIDDIEPGEEAAQKTLEQFLKYKIDNYDTDRNDPNKDAQSNLSPYLHFGHISAQRVALEVRSSKTTQQNKDAFLEELIIRKELSDNYCYYNENYDSPKGYPDWAIKTLEKHSPDKRSYIYTQQQFEEARTHDKLWNAAQSQMVKTGKMHGYLRMYWAKKILEWTSSYQEAHEIAIHLNDKYQLDGRDPNGYTGVAWSIGGVHDRPWKEREIFGMIRYMNYNGCKRKFNVEEFIAKFI